MTEDDKKDLIERYLAAYNRFDVEGMMAVLDPDVRFTNFAEGMVTAMAQGADEFRALAHASMQLFASRRQQALRFDFARDTATVAIAFEGILAEDLPDGARAGEVLRLTGRSEFEFRDGKISKITDRS